MLLYARLFQRCLRLKTFCRAADWALPGAGLATTIGGKAHALGPGGSEQLLYTMSVYCGALKTIPCRLGIPLASRLGRMW